MIHRPELLKRAAWKQLRRAVILRRIARGHYTNCLDRAFADYAVIALHQDAQELRRLAHVPRPSYESPGQWLARMVDTGQMSLCAPAEVPAVSLSLAKAA